MGGAGRATVKVSWWFRSMELDRSRPGHPVGGRGERCPEHGKHGVDDGYNSFLCPTCGAWLGQVRPVSAYRPSEV